MTMEYKTNVMRILDKNKIKYNVYNYVNSDAISGLDVAAFLNEDPNRVFKTLVTVGKSNNYYVFVLPVNEELDLKKAAYSVTEKNVEMVKSKDLLSLTGYIHGGCSPIGMKKMFKTVFHYTAKDYNMIMFSAGKIGYQVEMNISDLKKIIDYKLDDIVSNSELK